MAIMFFILRQFVIEIIFKIFEILDVIAFKERFTLLRIYQNLILLIDIFIRTQDFKKRGEVSIRIYIYIYVNLSNVLHRIRRHSPRKPILTSLSMKIIFATNELSN